MSTSKVFSSAALIATVILLAAAIKGVPDRLHAILSSLPLALAGLGYAILQISLRPSPATLLKRLLLAATFIGWAVDQILPPGFVATLLGDLVIGAYVLDLSWIMQEQAFPEQTTQEQNTAPSTHPRHPPGDERV